MISKKSIPNLLTILRLCLAPVSIVLLAWKENLHAAGIVFLICCFTDFLDGYLARKWNVQSAFGKTFDPIADKLLIVGILIVLLVQQRVIGFVGVTLIFRDVIMDVLRLCLWRFHKIIPAIKTAKIKTVLQMIGIAFILLYFKDSPNIGFFPSESKPYIEQIPLIAAMFFSLWSFVSYLRHLNKKQ